MMEVAATNSAPTEDRPTYRQVPASYLEAENSRFVWSQGGLPLRLDAAADAIYRCFDVPATVDAVAADLSEVVGLSPSDSLRVVDDVVEVLRKAGHLVPSGSDDPPEKLILYPPMASP
jgi:hypothetical protein